MLLENLVYLILVGFKAMYLARTCARFHCSAATLRVMCKGTRAVQEFNASGVSIRWSSLLLCTWRPLAHALQSPCLCCCRCHWMY